jgi:uncharacterized membrane protein YciS (DUF1049 family)
MENEILLKQLIRQVKILNIWVSFFGILFIATFVFAGILLFKLVVAVRNAEHSVQKFQTQTSQTLNVQDQACSNDALKSALQRAGYCK